ncbi:hypothetical protein [Salinibaculum rarum]|uniref:hypothetical protein n=1 Tax=Salinibaculum rarum TaxID=3058903 RepID=UPI00265DE0E1|nr:hypothetical protein [Salinibaculum sp. KK48]
MHSQAREHDQPESFAAAREAAPNGDFEVVLLHDEHGELGTLNKTFGNRFDAEMAAHEATVNGVIDTEIRRRDSN